MAPQSVDEENVTPYIKALAVKNFKKSGCQQKNENIEHLKGDFISRADRTRPRGYGNYTHTVLRVH